jgi:phosphorylcholine metabolism protein LicD
MNIITIIILLILLLILTNIFTHKITKFKENNKYFTSYVTYMKKIEENRNNIMNGVCDMKYYINFSFHYKLFNLFELLTKKLDENNIKYFLIGGALIGYYRHNQSFIPWDDDIDIGVLEEDRDKFHQVIKDLMKEDSNITLDIHDIDKVLYGKKDANPVQIDIFYYKYYPNEDVYSFYMDKLREWWPREKISKYELFPLQEIDFKLYLPDGKLMKEIKVKTVNKSKLYLDNAYPNWIDNIQHNIPHVQYYNDLFM